MTRVDPSMLDVFHRSLADRHRRLVLSYLLNGSGGSVTLDELVDCVMHSEPDSAPSDRQSIAASLYHQHLPLLAEQGLIDYEREQGTVRKTGRTEQIEPLVEIVASLHRKPSVDNPVVESRR